MPSFSSPGKFRGEEDIFHHREVRQEEGFLEDVSHVARAPPGEPVGGHPGELRPIHGDPSFRGPEEPGKAVEEGGFPAARRTDEGARRAVFELKLRNGERPKAAAFSVRKVADQMFRMDHDVPFCPCGAFSKKKAFLFVSGREKLFSYRASMVSAAMRSWLTKPVSSSTSLPISSVPVTDMGES